MSYIKERVAYLKGLAEGMQLSDATNEGKLLKAMLEVMDDMALAVDDLEEVQEQLCKQIDDMDEDLAEIEREVFNDGDEFDDDCYDECFCAEIDCPHCGEKINVDGDMVSEDEGVIQCPHCKKNIEVEWECECGCGHDHGDDDDEDEVKF